jgi:hypothetical protein
MGWPRIKRTPTRTSCPYSVLYILLVPPVAEELVVLSELRGPKGPSEAEVESPAAFRLCIDEHPRGRLWECGRGRRFLASLPLAYTSIRRPLHPLTAYASWATQTMIINDQTHSLTAN